MSLDPDRSPDDEPTAPAGQPRAHPLAPTFTPAPVPADAGTAAGERTASEHDAPEHAPDEPTLDEGVAAEPVNAGSPGDEPAATEATAAEAAAEPTTGEPTASEVTAADGSADLAASQSAERADRPADRVAGIEPTADLDGPLLSDADELRASWQRIQAAFVDDPREAVTDAAGLVEHTAQALAGALRQRQWQLRATWDPDGLPDGVEYADSGGTAPRAASPAGNGQAADGPDTEQLRRLIQRYRMLFNHLCRP